MIAIVDGLILVVAVLFAVAGARRGPWPEAVTLGGLVLGALLADEWGEAWGNDLAGLIGAFDGGAARLIVRLLLFLGPLLVIGYGGALLLPARGRPSVRARTVGALLGLFNGLAVSAVVLRNWYYSGGARDAGLANDLFAGAMLSWAGWWPLVLALGGTLAVIVAVLRRPRPARKPAVLPPTDPDKRVGEPGDLRPAPSASPSGTTGGAFAGSAALPPPYTSPPAGNGGAAPAVPPHAESRPVPVVTPPARPGEERRCRTCSNALAPGAAFCPNCGTPVS